MTSALAALTSVLLAAGPVVAGVAPANVVSLVPLGKVDPGLLKVAVQAIEARVACKVRVEVERALPKSAWNEARKRWRAEKLIEALEADRPPGAWKVVGITAAEMSTTKKGTIEDGRVRGEGEVGGRVSVLSTWVDEQSARTTAELHALIAQLAVHEVGHTLGLGHCGQAGCVMREAERRAPESGGPGARGFCEACRKKLGERVLRGR